MSSFLTRYSESFKAAELLVSEKDGSYKGLDLAALCTDAEDISRIISDPLIQGTWVDLGSGPGHTVLAYTSRFPERSAKGIEREEARVSVARMIADKEGLSCEFVCGDLLSDELPEGDVYFLYLPQGHVIDRILSELSRQKTFILVAIESHGDLLPRLDRENWLLAVKEIPLRFPRHYPNARLYRPRHSNDRTLAGLHAYSFQEKYFLLKENSSLWIGDSFGLAASGDGYLLLHPPRTVKEDMIVKIMTNEELSQTESFLVSLRRLSGVTFEAEGRTYSGPLRKIIRAPAFSVEFPGGERVEWNRIERIKQGTRICYEFSSPLSFSLPVP